MPPVELRGISWDHPRGHDCMVATAEAYAAVAAGRAHHLGDAQPAGLRRFSGAEAGRELRSARHRPSLCRFRRRRTAACSPWTSISTPGCSPIRPRTASGPATAAISTAAISGRWPPMPPDMSAAYRPDLLAEIGGLPRTWDEVLALAEARRNRSAPGSRIPLIPVDALMSFCSICAAADEPPRTQGAGSGGQPRDRAAGAGHAAGACRTARIPRHCRATRRALLDLMSTTDEIAYMPLLFGYSNYARPGFRPSLVRFTGVPTVDGGDVAGRHPGRRRGGHLRRDEAPGGRGGLRRVRGQPRRAARDLLRRRRTAGAPRRLAGRGGQRRLLGLLPRTPWPRSTAPISARDTWVHGGPGALRRADPRTGWPAGGSSEALLDRLDALYRESKPEGKE